MENRKMGNVYDDLFGSNKSDSSNATTKTTKEVVTNTVMSGLDAFMRTSDDLLKSIEKQGRDLREKSRQNGLVSDEELAKMEKEIQKDFGITMQETNKATTTEKKELVKDLEIVNQLQELLGKELIGQKEFIKRFMIGFKRPNVSGIEDGKIANAILLCGNSGYGKHTAVNRATSYLGFENYIRGSKAHIIDLADYSGKEQENIFLQDMFMASNDENAVILFDHVELASTYFLQSLCEVIQEGALTLNKRYGLNKGQLVEANNALLTNAVKELTFAGKYLIFLSEKPLSKLTDSFGTTFTSLFKDICESDSFTEEELRTISEMNIKEVTYKTQEKLNFTLTYDESIIHYLCTLATTTNGVIPIVSMCSKIFEALAQYKLEEGLNEATIALKYDNDIVFTVGEASFTLNSMFRQAGSKELQSIKEELDKIVGLGEVKEYLMSLEDDYKVQAMRKAQGFKTTTVSKHMIFTGNPGTGKTTIARILSRYLKSIGVLSGGQLVEVTRADLVGRYVGHTAPLTNQVIKSALGGVLFIDEAYSLYRGKDDSFGLEAIDILVKGMEDNRDNLVVVLAGYSKEMKEFLTANSGLKSRFPNIVEFPDYTGEELVKIATIQANSKDYRISEDAMAPLLEYFTRLQQHDSKSSGNGRAARNLIEAAILNQSRRLIAEPNSDMQELQLKDFDFEIKE